MGSSKKGSDLLHYLAFHVYVDDTSNFFCLLFLSLFPHCLEIVHLYEKNNDGTFSDGLVRNCEE